jgi:YVTN family beta-propeller protein
MTGSARERTGPLGWLGVASVLLLLLLGALPTAPSATVRTDDCSPCESIQPVVATLAAVPVQSNPQAPVFGGLVYVANKGSDTVSVIQGTRNIGNVSVGSDPLAPAFDYDSGAVYVPNSGSSSVSVLAGAGLDATVTVGPGPLTPAFDEANGDIYVPNSGGCTVSFDASACGDTVSVLSGTSVVATVTVGQGPETPAVNTDPNSAFYGDVYVPAAVSDASDQGTLSVLSAKTNSVIAVLELGSSPPSGAFFDPENDYVYAGPYVISGVTMVTELSVPCDASCILDPYSGVIYVPGSSDFSTISGTSTATYTCLACGGAGTFDPVNGWAYLGWGVSGTTPFAVLPMGVYGADSFDPEEQSVYSACGGCYYDNATGAQVFGNVVLLMGNMCVPPGPGDFYNANLTALCAGGGGGGQSTSTQTNATTTGPNGNGTHVFSVVTSGSIPMASGNWTASGSEILKQGGGATISFTLSGMNGSRGFATIQILKAEIVFLVGLSALGGSSGLPTNAGLASWAPQVYVDGQVVSNATVTQDSTYVYVTFPIHFSTHHISFEWRPPGAAGAPGSSSGSTASGGVQLLELGAVAVAVVLLVATAAAAYMLYRARRRRE